MAGDLAHSKRFVDAAWWREQRPVQALPCIPYAIMEPYVVMRRTASSPMYNEHFINYGYNKVQFIDELEHRGYVFAVLTVGFGFDIPHKPWGCGECVRRRSVYADEYEESWRVHNVINKDVYTDFLEHLKEVKKENRQPICDYAKALEQYKGSF